MFKDALGGDVLDQATYLARKGFHVFPCRPNSKLPAIKGWPEKATCDLLKVQEMFSNMPPSANIGISTHKYNGGSGLIVIDIDKKDGRNGFETLEFLKEMGCELPVTLAAKTPTGGLHLFYSVKESVKQGTNVLGRGIDIRSKGGYVVGAGSTIDGKSYAWKSEHPIVGAPTWLAEKCQKGSDWMQDPSVPKSPPVEVNQDTAKARGQEYLENLGPALSGSRNDQAFKAACKLRDLGCDFTTCLELMLNSWRAEPSLGQDEIDACTRNAYKYGANDAGINAPEKIFAEETKIHEASDLESQSANVDLPKSHLYIKSFSDCIPNLSRPFLVDEIIDPGGMSVLYGESNTGKSFFATDLGLHIALGREWHTKKVQQGRVIYVAAESGLSIERRLFAFRRHHDIGDARVDFDLIPCQVDLLNGKKGDVEPLINLAMSRETKPALIVIDTLARAIAGGNENQSDHMGAFIRNIDYIREKTGAHVMLVHHSGKDQLKGARGHSSLRAATDTEIEIAHFTATIKKQRDREFAKPIGFRLKQVEIGVDEVSGKTVTSCVVEARNSGVELAFGAKKITGRVFENFKVLESTCLEFGESLPASWKIDGDFLMVHKELWKKKFYATLSEEIKDSTKRMMFTRSVKELISAGFVKERDNFCWITEDGWDNN